ncbi:hypothetical protein FA09DRAFT_333817 [Tilletiopsis washingtonensis]|uniref:DUF567-domain-containing protein n=1 Tax=Tilletiopsis washingtonensis TaxID=58919 RepID=A0A316ZF35_9BASI|nr:hypothetical protein FA09DRAFT_333817 [Tilletiopsis washingtonensis]PWN99522.1 hypothetical protein FA09DRAFT_333817 [Tilletiopsis washingtonensis]
MGLFSSLTQPSVAAPLAPVPHPIGVLPAFCQHQQQMALKIREHKVSLTGDDFSIKDAMTNQTIFKVDGKALSLSGRKDVLDASGTKLFQVRKKHIAIHTTYQGIGANDEVLFTVSSRMSLGTKLEIKVLVLKGDFFDRNATITTKEGVPVASIGRSFANAGQVLFDKQTYILNVAPGVDAALMVAVAICLDEKANETN